jgi:sterol desaturase/sphingolipid hydroxylase (fatty acid hydroxylase superfamily)
VNQFLSFLGQCRNSIIQGVIALSVGFVLFTLMERAFLFRPLKKSWRATLLDLQYAFLSMLYPPFIDFILAAIFGLLAVRIVVGPPNPHASVLSFAGQLLAVLFVRDCLIYLRHRVFHTRPVWAFHSIHHSSEEVNWLSALRFHPAEIMIESALEILLFLGCQIVGVAPAVLSVAAVMVAFYNLFIHSNLRWTFGPLRYLIVSPVFHRWHHSDSATAMDKNFAAMFSCIDLVFGTYFMPRNGLPQTTGLSAKEKAVHPRSLAGQLVYPFRKR